MRASRVGYSHSDTEAWLPQDAIAQQRLATPGCELTHNHDSSSRRKRPSTPAPSYTSDDRRAQAPSFIRQFGSVLWQNGLGRYQAL
jgi:hypothetical protein